MEALLLSLCGAAGADPVPLPEREKVLHAALVAFSPADRRYKVVETWVPDEEESAALKPLLSIADLPQTFEFRDLLVIKLSVEGRPRFWLPVDGQVIDLSRYDKRLKRVLLDDLRRHWKIPPKGGDQRKPLKVPP